MAQEIDITNEIKELVVRTGNRVKDHFQEYNVSAASFIHGVTFWLIIILSVAVRLMPNFLGWTPYLKAFDPWMQYRSAEYIIENDLFQFFKWRDPYSWYPYGREVGVSMYIGVPLAITFVYWFLNFIGFNVSLQTAAYLVPVIFGTLGVVYTYRLAKVTISDRAALFAALIMAVTPSFLSRSIAGFTDNEALGVLFTVATFFYFMRAMSWDVHADSIKSGIALFGLASSWGAFRFGYDLLGIYALVLLITGNFSEKLLRHYSTTIGVSTFLMILIPRVGGSFLLSTEGIGPIGVLILMVLYALIRDLTKDLSNERIKRVLIGLFSLVFLLSIAVMAILVSTGFLDRIGDKFISVLLPNDRENLPLIDSVAEHQPLAWIQLYLNISTMVFFIPLGIYEAINRVNERNLFILTFGLTSIYFSGSMIRLMLVLAPAGVLLTALAIDRLLIPFGLIGHKRIEKKDKASRYTQLQRIDLVTPYIIVAVLLGILLFAGLSGAQSRAAPEITPVYQGEAQTPPYANHDWLQTFEWMKQHTSYKNYDISSGEKPPTMLSWWDYGYYLTVLGETITLADGATINSTHIGVVGTMLMWKPEDSINLMYKYGVKYVMVNSAGGNPSAGSDIAKSIWMIKISEQYTPQFGIVEEEYYDIDEGGYHGKYLDSTILKLMAYKAPEQDGAGAPFIARSAMANVPFTNLQDVVFDSLDYFTEVFRSNGFSTGTAADGDYPIIRIFEVNYPEDIELRVAAFEAACSQGLPPCIIPDSNSN